MNWFIVLLVYCTSTAVTARDILLTQPDTEYRHYVYPSGRITYNVVIKPTQDKFVEKSSKYTPVVPTPIVLPNEEVQRQGNLAHFDPNLFKDLVVTHIPTYVYNAKNSQKSPKKFIPTENESQFALPEVVRLSDLIRLSGPSEYRYAKRADGIKWVYKDEYQGKLSSRRKRSAEEDDGETPELGSATEDVDAAPTGDALDQLEDRSLGEGQEASEKDVNLHEGEEISEPGDDIEAEANENENIDAASQDDATDQILSGGADTEAEAINDDTTDQKLSGGADIEAEVKNEAASQEEDGTTDQELSGGADIEARSKKNAASQDDATDQELSGGADTEAETINDAANQEEDDTTDQKLSGGADTEAEAKNEAASQEEDGTTDQKLSGGGDIEAEAIDDATNQEEDTTDQKLSGGADIEAEAKNDAASQDNATDQELPGGADIEAEAKNEAASREEDGTTDQELSGEADIEAEAKNDAASQDDGTTDQKLSGGADIEAVAKNDAEGQEEDDITDQTLSGGLIEPRVYGLVAKVDTGIEDDRKADLEPVVTNAEENGDEDAELNDELHQAEPGEVSMYDTGDDLETQPEALVEEAEPKDNEDEGHAVLEEEPETDRTSGIQSSGSQSTLGTEQEDNVADEVESIEEEPITGFEEESETGQMNEIEPSVIKSTSGTEQEGDDTAATMQQNKGENIDKESTTALDEEPETIHNEGENISGEAATVLDEETETGPNEGKTISEEPTNVLDEEPKTAKVKSESTIEEATPVLDAEPETGPNEGESISEETSTESDEEPEEKEEEKISLPTKGSGFGDEPQAILTTTLGPPSVDSVETMKNTDDKYSSDAGTRNEDKKELRMFDRVPVTTETPSLPITRQPKPQPVRTVKAPIITTQRPLEEMHLRVGHRNDLIKNDYTETVANNVKNYIQARSVIAENLPSLQDLPKPTPPSYVNEQRNALLRFQECIRTRSMGQSPCSLSAFLAEEYAKTTTSDGLTPP